MDTQKDLLKSRYGRNIKMIVARTGLRLSDFAINYSIPLRTLEDWVAGKRPIKRYVLDLLDSKVDSDFADSKRKGVSYMSYFAYSYDDGDNWEGTYGTEDDAYGAAVFESADKGRRPFLISLFREMELTWNTTAEDIIREIEENLDDEIGDVGSFDIASGDDEKDLDNRLNSCINKWIRERKIGASTHLISWTKEYVYDSTSMEYRQNDGYIE